MQPEYSPTLICSPIREDVCRLKSRQRVILVYSKGISRAVDIAAFLDVFTEANKLLAVESRYTVRFAERDHASILPSGCEVHIESTPTTESDSKRPDIFVMVSSDEAPDNKSSLAERTWVRERCAGSERVVAIAGGVLLLAMTGVLDGKKAATHWALQDQLEKVFPRTLLQRDVLFAKDGEIYTCAGATGSVDLALNILEEDLGCDVAAEVSARMLLPFRRVGNTKQISETLRAQKSSASPVARLLCWLPDHLHEDLSVANLSRRVAMSPRNFARSFRAQLGMTPGKYIERLRVEAAQRELQRAPHSITKAAEVSGLRNVETFRRLFVRHLDVTPGQFLKSQASRSPVLQIPIAAASEAVELKVKAS